MALKNEKLIDEIYNELDLKISGLNVLEDRLNSLNKKWFTLTFSRKQEKDFLNIVVPKLKILEKEFIDKFSSFLEHEKKEFLKQIK